MDELLALSRQTDAALEAKLGPTSARKSEPVAVDVTDDVAPTQAHAADNKAADNKAADNKAAGSKVGKAKGKWRPAVDGNWAKLAKQVAPKSLARSRKRKRTDAAAGDGRNATPQPELDAQAAQLVASAKGAPTKILAMDCEMVEVEGGESALARVSIVNQLGAIVLDTYVRPSQRVTDFRTDVSGITPALIREAPSFETVQKQVADILTPDRIIIGHHLSNDFQALLLAHPARNIRDTSLYRGLGNKGKRQRSSLRKLAAEKLGLTVQAGEHSSVEDARTALALYHHVSGQWEKEIAERRVASRKKQQGKAGKTDVAGSAAVPAASRFISSEEGPTVPAATAQRKRRRLDPHVRERWQQMNLYERRRKRGKV